jgi:hypothetical protein
LISIHSAEENEFIRNYVKEQPSSSTNVWIGLERRSSASREFVWVDKSPVDYDNWRINEPNNAGGNEDYTLMIIYKNGTWNDVSNNNNFTFVCGFNCK